MDGNINQKLKHLPESAGVYVMLDNAGQIIYVGKAKNLKNRVRQYFFNSVKTHKVWISFFLLSSYGDFFSWVSGYVLFCAGQCGKNQGQSADPPAKHKNNENQL